MRALSWRSRHAGARGWPAHASAAGAHYRGPPAASAQRTARCRARCGGAQPGQPHRSAQHCVQACPRGTKAWWCPRPDATARLGRQAPASDAGAAAADSKPAALPAQGSSGRSSGPARAAARAPGDASPAPGWDDTAAKGQPLVPDDAAASQPSGDSGGGPGRCSDAAR